MLRSTLHRLVRSRSLGPRVPVTRSLSYLPGGPFEDGRPAQLVSINNQGQVIEREVIAGNFAPDGAEFLIPVDIGESIGTAVATSQTLSGISDMVPLVYHHATRTFTHPSSPLPRFTITWDLPPPTDGPTSPATLYMFGLVHSITLNGTEDAYFTKILREMFYESQPQLKFGVYYRPKHDHEFAYDRRWKRGA